MEFTDENKQTILDLLKAGKRSAALQFISSEFRVSTGDADKLLAAFEGQFMKAGQSNQTASTSISGCVGCFSGLLKGISIFIALIGIGILGVGYFIPEFINRAGSDMMVPTIVDSEYFPTSDSSNVRLIVKFNHQGIIVSDTTYTIYSRGMYFPGDSLRIDADLLGVTIDMSKTEGVMETQKVIYFLGAGALFFAFIFFLVSTRVKTVIK